MPTPRISDEKVATATGKTLSRWFALLDRAGAKKMEHRDIAALLSRRYKVPGWWTQMVTVEYERTRKGRRPHQRAAGYYEVGVTKTVSVSVAAAYRSWNTPAKRRALTGSTFVTTTVRPGKVLRGKLADGTSLVVDFRPRPGSKSHVVVTHGKLKNAAAAIKSKKFWRARLEKFAANL